MNGKQEFWDYFNNACAPKLSYREKTFRKIFEYLDSLEGPIRIVETGCARKENNWAGDGQSTVMFDKYITFRDQDSTCCTVDINPTSVAECQKLVSERVTVVQDDSVHYLGLMARDLLASNQTIDFLYLDSYDLDKTYWQPSAIHHLKELCCVMSCLSKETLVVVDDCPLNADFIISESKTISFITDPTVGGKGRLVAEFAKAFGAKLEFSEYQAGWTGLR